MSYLDTILSGDCIELLEALPLDQKKFDCVIIDPPYSSGARRDTGRTTRNKMIRGEKFEWFSHDNMSTSGFTWFLRQLLLRLKPRMSAHCHGFIFSDWRQYPTVSYVIESTGFRLNDLIVWNKTFFGMGTTFRNQHELISFFSYGKPKPPKHHDIANVLDVKNISVNKRLHPTQKPIKLLDFLIRASTEEGDLVVDPMCGSGSTLVSAKILGRRYLGIEINEAYIQIAQKWLGNTHFIPKKISEFKGP